MYWKYSLAKSGQNKLKKFLISSGEVNINPLNIILKKNRTI